MSTDGTDSHLTALMARQKSGIKSGPKKRHGAELVMRVQSSMALIDNIVKNMSTTFYDGRHKMDGMAKKVASKADQKSDIKQSWSCGFKYQWL